MNEVLKFLGFVVVGVVLPLAVVLGVYFGILPQEIKSIVATVFVALAIAVIVGFSVWLLWDDIKTARYSKA
jgi:membrane protein DedA with SNARE-associated domain